MSPEQGTTTQASGRSGATSGASGKPGPEDTQQRPALTERVAAAVGSLRREHAANAEAPVRPAARSAAPGSASRAPRRARLRLTRIDPWSVMKTAFLLSMAFGVVTVVAVFVIWSTLNAADVFTSINKTVSDVVGGDSASSFDVTNYVGLSRVMGFTLLIAAIDVVLISAIATLGAFLYNLSAALLGGIEVTLAED